MAVTLACDAVLFATRKMRTQSEDAGFNRKRKVAHEIGKDGGSQLNIHLQVARQIWNLPTRLDPHGLDLRLKKQM